MLMIDAVEFTKKILCSFVKCSFGFGWQRLATSTTCV